MKYSKAIFIDVDGTLLNNDHQYSESTYTAIQKLKKQNHLIVLATGRPPDAVFFIAEALGLQEYPIVCLNGALIYEKEQLIFQKSIDADVVRVLLEKMSVDLTFSFLEKRNWFVNKMDFNIQKEMEIIKMKAKAVAIDEQLQLWKRQNTGVHKILCIGTLEEVKFIQKQILELNMEELNVLTSKPTYLEITHHESAKEKAMLWLLDKFEIPLSNSIAIGDGFNDKKMIAQAATGIAMENAHQQVKKVANYITLSNENDGFTNALKTLKII